MCRWMFKNLKNLKNNFIRYSLNKKKINGKLLFKRMA